MEIAWKEAVAAMLNSETLEKVFLSLAVSGTGLLGAYLIWCALRDLVAERQAAKDHKPSKQVKR
jgi:hypothetical protein